MSEQEQVEKLVIELQEILDFDELESRIYLTLLRTGPITASSLAKDLNVDRARMYRCIDKLVDRNIISTTLSSPKLCIAIEPENALKLVLERKESEIMRIKKSGDVIVEKITGIRYCPNQGTAIPTLGIIQGRTNIYSDIAQMIENCTDTLYIATTLEDVSKMYHSIIPEKIKICEKIGGKVMLLVEIDDIEMISFVERFNATETRVCRLPSKGRIIVQKDKQLIMSDCGQTDSTSEADFSISTNSKAMISHIDNLCRLLWKSSKPLKMTSHKKTINKIRP
jgi:sugar-specific transcriptional regulator TrmB